MIRITTDVFCDICGNWEHGLVSHKAETRKARKEVKKKSWIYSDNKDFCYDCWMKEPDSWMKKSD